MPSALERETLTMDVSLVEEERKEVGTYAMGSSQPSPFRSRVVILVAPMLVEKPANLIS